MSSRSASLKKSVKKFLAGFLFCRPFGTLAGFIKCNRFSIGDGVVIKTSSTYVSPSIKAMLFWGCYERAEMAFVRKYLANSLDVVELGGSIGVMSCVIGKRLNGKKLVVVEADPELCKIIEENLSFNCIVNYRILANAIAAEKGSVEFRRGRSSTHGSTVASTGGGFAVPSNSLSGILESEGIEEFALVCDIEGAELDLLLSDAQSLKSCQQIIIETHDVQRFGREYRFDEVSSMFTSLGFQCIDSLENTFVFIRRNTS